MVSKISNDIVWACAVCVHQLTVRALHVCAEAGQAPQECCLRVSLMPLRLNIDQVQNKTVQLPSNHISDWWLNVSDPPQFLSIFFVQDALFFLKNFFTSLAAEVELFSPPEQEGNNRYAKYDDLGNINFVWQCRFTIQKDVYSAFTPCPNYCNYYLGR